LVHLIQLGQLVFLEPNELEGGPQFNQEALKMAIKNILQQYGLTDTTKMIEDTVISGQTYT
jgi:hypothetical protein